MSKRAASRPGALFLVGYGVLVLTATIAMMYLGYARYEDPSVHPVAPRRARNATSSATMTRAVTPYAPHT